MPLMQSEESEEVGPRLRAEAEMGNEVPPKLRLIFGKELHGTTACQQCKPTHLDLNLQV